MSSVQQPQQQINLADLDIAQLAEVRRQLDDELSHLTNSFSQLKQAQVKFKACIENVAEIKPENKSHPILVPLTNSLYVPGKLTDVEHVIVDVGTGYYVKKTRSQAREYYDSKVTYIQSNLETLQETIGRKQEVLGMVQDTIGKKATTPSNTKSK